MFDKMIINVKIFSAIILFSVMVAKAPVVLKPVTYAKTVEVAQVTIPERIATTETKLRDLEEHIYRDEQAQRDLHLAERLTVIETRQSAVLALLIPVALFIFTHTLELIWKIKKGSAK